MTPEALKLQAQARRRRAEAEGQAPGGKPGVSMSDVFGETSATMVDALPDFLKGGKTQGFVAGLTNVPANAIEGIRQVANLGDPEELAQLNAEKDQRKAKLDELIGENEGSALAGEVVGSLIPAGLAMRGARALEQVPAAARVLQSGTGILGKTGRAVTAGGVGGGLAAGSQSLGTEAEQSGERGIDAAVGTGLGIFGGAVGAPAAHLWRAGRDQFRKLAPEKALEDFLEKSVGVTRGSNVADIVDSLRGKAEGKVADMRKAFDRLYARVERNPALPQVALKNTQVGQIDPGLAETLGNFGPAKRVLKLMDEGSANPVQILGPNGQPISAPHRAVDFQDVRQTRRHLKGLIDKEQDPAKKTVLEGIRNRLEKDLDEWAGSDPTAMAARDAASEIDELYRTRMGPMVNKGQPVGDWRRKGFSEKGLNTGAMGTQTGAEIEDIATRIPGTRGDARRYYAAKMLGKGTMGETAPYLRMNSTRDRLFRPQERQYMDTIADALRNDAKEPWWIKQFPNALQDRLPTGTSVLPYGQLPTPAASRNALIDFLKAGTVTRAYTSEE